MTGSISHYIKCLIPNPMALTISRFVHYCRNQDIHYNVIVLDCNEGYSMVVMTDRGKLKNELIPSDLGNNKITSSTGFSKFSCWEHTNLNERLQRHVNQINKEAKKLSKESNRKQQLELF